MARYSYGWQAAQQRRIQRALARKAARNAAQTPSQADQPNEADAEVQLDQSEQDTTAQEVAPPTASE